MLNATPPPGAGLPLAPLTLEGAAILHQMFRIRWPAWRQLPVPAQQEAIEEATTALKEMGQTAIFSLLGHKGDLLFLHFRNTFKELNAAELRLTQLQLSDYLEITTSYLSVVELGLYDSTVRLHAALQEKGVQPGSPEWEQETQAVLAQQSKAMQPRLFPEIPSTRYLCFYPMDKRRGESKNWYQVPMPERQRLMHEHGMIGRRYSGEVRQIISGSIGFDNWEWGVDLFADDPLVFKRLIYEMRFDEASAAYALFGPFYLGLRIEPSELDTLLSGRIPRP